jgi:hypothetical protein
VLVMLSEVCGVLFVRREKGLLSIIMFLLGISSL